MQILKSFFVLLLLISFTNANAQYTEVINSNRPGVSKSAFSVGTGVVQFETGAFTVKEEHALADYDVSGFGFDFALRYGLFFEQLELSLDGVYQNDTQTFNGGSIPRENKRSNLKNFTLGAKYLVYDPYKNAGEEKPNIYSFHANNRFSWKSLIPAVAVYAGANFDTEDNPYTAPDIEGFSPKVMLATQNNFNGGWVFVMNLIMDRIATDQSDFQYIFTLTHSFTPQWVVFGEAQGIKSDFYADNIFRFGGAYLWTKNFQLDANVAFNTKDTPTVLNIAFGASYRLDFHKDKKIDNGNGNDGSFKKKKNKNKKNKKKNVDDFES
ncbi:transporter [Winogradskyella undariae]|uniref:transporter n=1 Tax=Winogradskyella undariae TaxID=1285465 RepID=UPI00156B0007|nr:transporter [Winogradskyella undariae]NRR93094.1 transporter [Winogradskyella undariae]